MGKQNSSSQMQVAASEISPSAVREAGEQTAVRPSQIDIDVELAGRDRLSLQLNLSPAGHILHARLTGSGCPDLLQQMVQMRSHLQCPMPLAEIRLPIGTSHSVLLMRELILRAKGDWDPPFQERELCHCRAVSTAKVDRAIVCGSHSISAIARETSAGTSCGTCRIDSEALISFRLGLDSLKPG